MAEADFQITAEQAELINRARVFFIASADPGFEVGPNGIGPVNVSPKGGARLHIIDANTVAYLDYGGSGNETARHAAQGAPVTIMVCSFEPDDAAIVRLYGRASVNALEDSEHAARLLSDLGADPSMRQRQIIVIDVERSMTSCGYTLPVMEFVRERQKSNRGRKYKT